MDWKTRVFLVCVIVAFASTPALGELTPAQQKEQCDILYQAIYTGRDGIPSLTQELGKLSVREKDLRFFAL